MCVFGKALTLYVIQKKKMLKLLVFLGRWSSGCVLLPYAKLFWCHMDVEKKRSVKPMQIRLAGDFVTLVSCQRMKFAFFG